MIHGGLGTTVDALRVHKPIAVSGVLLMDQRFWGQVCADKGVGPPPVHIDEFPSTCEEYVQTAFAEGSPWLRAAEDAEWGEEGNDGVAANVEIFVELLAQGKLDAPLSTGPKGRKGNYFRVLAWFSDKSITSEEKESEEEAKGQEEEGEEPASPAIEKPGQDIPNHGRMSEAASDPAVLAFVQALERTSIGDEETVQAMTAMSHPMAWTPSMAGSERELSQSFSDDHFASSYHSAYETPDGSIEHPR